MWVAGHLSNGSHPVSIKCYPPSTRLFAADQVKMIYKGGGVSKKEKDDYARAIRRNVIESMQVGGIETNILLEIRLLLHLLPI